MTRIRLFAALAALALVAVVPAQAAVVKLTGTVGPGFTITLKSGGKNVKTLKAGKVSLTVSDLSSAHNFHLTGPGVNKKTSVAKTGKTTWLLTLKKGTYRFVCDPHASSMKGSFKVS
jgi:plastocyanin